MTFEQFVRSRTRPLLRTATAICLDQHLAEDLVQDVLVKLHNRWDTVVEIENLDAYARRMLINEHLSWRRKWSRLIPHAEPLDRSTSDERDAGAPLLDRSAFSHALVGLPERQRLVLALRYQADLDDAEIATAMGCSRGTVRGYASRALHTLRTQTSNELSETKGS